MRVSRTRRFTTFRFSLVLPPSAFYEISVSERENFRCRAVALGLLGRFASPHFDAPRPGKKRLLALCERAQFRNDLVNLLRGSQIFG